MSTKIKTKFGNAVKNKRGYYIIFSHKEGNKLKYLHRLIYEDYHGVTLLPETVIHHINGDTTDNSIVNLEMMTHSEHNRLHMVGENNPNYGNPLPEETKQKMSKAQNTSGYFRVNKLKDKKCKQGFRWRYVYYENGKQKPITCVSLDKLKEKVLAKGLVWAEI